MSKQTPLVSIVIPVYNREDTIVRCIDSALSQTYDNIEIIVVDDASTDRTVECIRSTYSDDLYLIEHTRNRGGSAARNTGIDEASGEYIALLDSDDAWRPEKVEHQVKILSSRSDKYAGIYCGTEYVSQDPFTTLIKNLAISPSTDKSCTIEEILSLQTTLGGASTILVRRSVVNKINGFDEDFTRHQDLEFLIRCLKEGEMIYMHKPYVIKFETNYPSANSVSQAKELFFHKFSDEISVQEQNGVPISEYHNFDLARCHIRNGDLIEAIELLKESKPPSTTDVLSFAKAVFDRLS
ncbi:glycosyltransferase family 2 protein [Halosimplex rubrum]|uniref:Glycosyltransferase family 2 protein n=1 Tax=Halosimplex rubrum TaxID=869889 RepID=A0A7D5P439_9EURY|nr:glycosyltransferase family A protein [Halosimplex rubrum]QLH76898.1 glycosyltransferase family 2 protein [Halosimplex rubrum]